MLIGRKMFISYSSRISPSDVTSFSYAKPQKEEIKHGKSVRLYRAARADYKRIKPLTVSKMPFKATKLRLAYMIYLPRNAGTYPLFSPFWLAELDGLLKPTANESVTRNFFVFLLVCSVVYGGLPPISQTVSLSKKIWNYQPCYHRLKLPRQHDTGVK